MYNLKMKLMSSVNLGFFEQNEKTNKQTNKHQNYYF